MPLDGDARHIRRAIDERQLRVAWTADLMAVDGECAENVAILREEWRGPDARDAGRACGIVPRRVERTLGHVRDDHLFAHADGGPARRGGRRDSERAELLTPGVG